MRSLAKLFNKCNTIPYKELGADVNFAFEIEGTTLYIYFEPSNSKLDWKHNFMFAQRPYKGMVVPYKVHRGFLKCWKTIEDVILERISDIYIKEIIIVGYSHGGALAMLCHELCWFHRDDIRDNIYGIAFDAPRVYAGFWVKSSLKYRWNNFIVVRNHSDIVTHVPPAIFGYRHVGTIMKVGKKKKYGCIKSHHPDKIYESLMESEWNENWKKFLNVRLSDD